MRILLLYVARMRISTLILAWIITFFKISLSKYGFPYFTLMLQILMNDKMSIQKVIRVSVRNFLKYHNTHTVGLIRKSKLSAGALFRIWANCNAQ